MEIKALTPYQQNSGFTLVELMVTLVVLGIITSIALPSFSGIIAQNRVTEASNRLTSSIQLVRSEAIKRNSPIGMKSDTTSQWGDGWNIYVGGFSGADSVGSSVSIRVFEANSDNVTIIGNSSAGMWLSFFANGMLNESSNAIFYVCNDSDASTGRMITIDRVGRPRVDDIPDGDDCTP